MNTQPIRIAIADDHELLRQGIIELINIIGGFEVVIKAVDGDDLIDQLSKTASLPDICMLDISMPNKNGYDTMKEIRAKWPDLKVLVISMFETEYSVLQMLRLGAKGYLCKNFTSLEKLKTALMTVHEKGFYQSDTIGQKAIRALNGNDKNAPRISDQEMVFIKHCCTNLSYEDISEIMNVSKRTIEGYRDSLFHKLGIKSRNELTLFALKNGIVSLEVLVGN